MGLSTELTGKIYPSATYGVTAEAIRAYAAATNEDNPAFAGERPVAPPAFPIVAASGALWAAMADEELGANLARLVHFGEDHLLHAPIRAGDVLSVESSLENVEAGEAGETFTLASRLTNQDGILAAEVRSLMLIRGSGRRRPRAEAQQGPPEVLFEVAQRVDEDQAFRYAEASGDRNAVHLDEEAARAAGFPGIILHGMCTMALAGKAVLDSVCGGDPARLERITVRFCWPVRPGQTLTTRGWLERVTGEVATYGFGTLNPAGTPVILGRAEATGRR